MKARVDVTGEPRPLPPDVELLLLRVAQECLHNSERHSGAQSVRVALGYESEAAHLVLSDDGRGMGEIQRPTTLLAHGKLGLLGIQERVRLAHGKLDIERGPGVGATIRVSVPVAET